jgi:hypothetical protein
MGVGDLRGERVGFRIAFVNKPILMMQAVGGFPLKKRSHKKA